MKTNMVVDYIECPEQNYAEQNYAELENAVQSASDSQNSIDLRGEVTTAKACLEKIAKMPSPAKEAYFVQNALADLFSLDRAA